MLFCFLFPHPKCKWKQVETPWGSHSHQFNCRIPSLKESWRGRYIPLPNWKKWGGCCASSSLAWRSYSRPRRRRGGTELIGLQSELATRRREIFSTSYHVDPEITGPNQSYPHPLPLHCQPVVLSPVLLSLCCHPCLCPDICFISTEGSKT